MANAGPATVTITSTTGPGQSVTTLKATDVTNLEYDFMRNVVRVTHQASGGTSIYDYSAMNTVTHTISANASTVTISS